MAMRRGCDGWCLASWRARLITVVLWWHSDTLTLVVENQLVGEPLCVSVCGKIYSCLSIRVAHRYSSTHTHTNAQKGR